MGAYDVATLLAHYEEQPTTEPMHGNHGEVRRNPSTDQKKVRRQMTKKQAAEAPTESIPELLARAASAPTLAEQERLMTEVEQRTTQRTASLDAERSLDLSIKEAVEIIPRGTHEMHTASTDWLMGDGMRVTASQGDAEHALVAEAAMWFDRCPDYVKVDQGEFRTQASNLARREASRYGDAAEAAYKAFITETERLYRQGQRTGSIKTAAMIHDLDNGGMVDDGIPADPAATDNTVAAPGHPPVDGHPGKHIDTHLPDTHDLAGTPGLQSEVDRHLSGQDASGVREMAQGYASNVTATLQRVASRQATAAAEDERLAAVLAGGMPEGMGEMADAVESTGQQAQTAMDSTADGVGAQANDFAHSQVTGASTVPQVGLPTQEFSTGGPGYPDVNTSSDRAPALEEIQNYQGWDGTSVVPQGNSGAQAANGDTEPTKDFAGTQGFPVSGSKPYAWIQPEGAPHPVGIATQRSDGSWSAGFDKTHAAKVAAQLTKESSMDQATCPNCGGHGVVAVRKQAYSGLPQIDQIVNADDSPGATPLPEDVAFGLTGWGASPQQGAQNVQNAIQQAEGQIDERNAKSPLATTGGQRVANGPDASGWLGDMGAKGLDYPGYSAPTGYDGSSQLGQPDPVYGYGGDQGNRPLQPYGEMEANDETNVPSQGANMSGPNDAGQAYRSVGPGMNTQGSFHPDPHIAAAQRSILEAQQVIAARSQQLQGR